MASDKVPKSTVSQSQIVTEMPNTAGLRMQMAVAGTSTDQHGEHHGEWIIWRGPSFRSAATAALADLAVDGLGVVFVLPTARGFPSA